MLTGKLAALATVTACDPSSGVPLSPASPSKGALNRVGGENIAALRERMSQIQMAYSQSRRSGTSASVTGGVGGLVVGTGKGSVEEGLPRDASLTDDGPVGGFSPLVTADGGGLEAIQRRIRDLSGGGVAQ